MRIFLEPTEALLFRTGKPFDAGSDVFAESLFPPTPETLQGAIRAAIATYWDRTKRPDEVFKLPALTNLIGDRRGYGRFRITGLALGRRQSNGTIERLFPAPVHLVKDEMGIIRLKPQVMAGVSSNMPKGMQYLIPDEPGARKGKLKTANFWLTEEGLQVVLRMMGVPDSQDVVYASEIYQREQRLGIGMQNETKTTREGYLYQIGMIRMQPGYGFVIDVHLSDNATNESTQPPVETLLSDDEIRTLLRLPSTGWVALGGEQRAARFEILPFPAGKEERDIVNRQSGKLLYFATPAAFEQGWSPAFWPAPLGEPLAAAVPGYQSIGGWALHPEHSGGESKVMRRCVPAGSVYFFEQPITPSYTLTDYGWQIGYGITYTGEY